MGNEMGNNNTTSALKEEDNASEAERKTFQETVKAESVEKGNQKTSATKGNDDDTKADELASNDTSELGYETLNRDTNGDGVKGENQTIPTSKTRHVMEEAAKASDDATIEPGKHTIEEDSHADDVNGPNQSIPMVEAENIAEKVRGLTTVESISMLENDSSKSDTREDVVIVENQMPPTAEAEDVQNNAPSLASNDMPNAVGNGSLEGDTYENDVNVDHQKHPCTEGEIVQGKAARIDLDDRTSELHQNKTPKETHDNDEQGENAMNPISGDLDVMGKATSLSSDDQSNVEDSFSDAGQEIAEITQAEKSPNAGLADTGIENYKILSSFLMECTEEYDKQKDLCLKKNQLVTYDHHLDNESSIKQEEENTGVLTSDALGISNDAELQESSLIHSYHNEFVKVLKEPSLQGSESLQRSDLRDINPLRSLDDDIISDKENEIQEIKLYGVKTDGRDGDGDEFGSSLRYASEVTDNSSSISEESNGSLLAKVNVITDHAMDSPPESDMVDNRVKFDHDEKCKALHEERKMSRSGSEVENSDDFKADMTNNTYGMTRRSNGDCNGEGNIVLASSIYGISDNDQVEEPQVTGNGHQFDVCIINNHNTSDEISTASVQEDFTVPEVEVDGLIPGSTVVNCRYEEEENNKEKVLEEIDKMPEASHATLKGLDREDMSKQCNSCLSNSGQKESLNLQNSPSLLYIYSYQEENVSQTKIFTSTSPQASDWKQENGRKSLGAMGNNLDSSNLTVPALDLVDDKAFEKEGKDYAQQAEATSLKEAEIKTSEANLPSVPYLNNSIFANGGYEAMESITRSSTESNPDNPNISGLIQKSPSFNLNLRIEATPEESDQIPLLPPGKTAIESLSNQTSLNLVNSMPCAEYEPRILQHEEMPVEEKVVTMERSYPEKFNVPFLGLLKEEEEAHLLVMPKKQDNHAGTVKEMKEMASTLPKEKEKRKPRSSFFSSCMCCVTLTN